MMSCASLNGISKYIFLQKVFPTLPLTETTLANIICNVDVNAALTGVGVSNTVAGKFVWFCLDEIKKVSHTRALTAKS